MTAELRQATRSDAEAICDLLSGLYAGDLGADFRSTVEAFLSENGSFAVIAEHGSQPVGILLARQRLELDFECRGAVIDAIVVKESHRGHGIGRLLFDALSKWATENGCGGILVPAGRGGFWEAVGMKGYEVRRYWRTLVSDNMDRA